MPDSRASATRASSSVVPGQVWTIGERLLDRLTVGMRVDVHPPGQDQAVNMGRIFKGQLTLGAGDGGQDDRRAASAIHRPGRNRCPRSATAVPPPRPAARPIRW